MKSIQQNLIAMLKEHSFRKHLTIVVGMIAIATVLSVVWSLHINGITLASDDPTCGLQEHVHTEACYDWVALDGTEEIDSTEGTEAIEATEMTEAIEATEGLEIAEAAESNGTEDTTSEASVSTVGTEASVSASGEETTAEETVAVNTTIDTEETTDADVTAVSGEGEESTGQEGTESVLDDTEEGTESLAEDGTEDTTEDVTEEATESPQPGDTKVVDGVMYVYELVCGLEEHTHTDECYAEEDSEEGAEETSSSTSSEDSSSTVVKSTTSLRSTSNTDSEEEEELVSVASIAEEVTEESTETYTLTSGSASPDTYYFVDSMTLVDAAANQDESYIVYTIIDGDYYVVSADDTLVKCKYLGDASATSNPYDTSNLVNNTAEAGMYCWFDESGKLTFKCTTYSSDDVFGDYRWTLSGTDLDTDEYGSGTYTLYNSENSVYIDPQDVGVSETLDATAWWGIGGYNETGKNYSLASDQMLIFTVACTADINDYAAFTVELTDTTQYLTTSSNDEAWLVDATYDSLTGNVTTGTGTSTITEGTTYTVTVERADTETEGSITASAYTVTYYNETSGTTFATIVATNTSIVADPVNVHIIAQVGTFEISAVYAVSKETAGTEIDTSSASKADLTLQGVTTDITTNETVTVDEVSYSTQTGKLTLAGDFDITYSFYNYGTNNAKSGTSVKSDKENNYVLILQEGSGGYVYVKPSFSAGAVNSSASVSVSGTEPTDWRTFGSQMNAGYSSASSYTKCYVNIVREKNVVTVTSTIVRNGNTSFESYTTVIYDSDLSDITVYLTAVNANLTDIDIENNSTSYDVTGYDAYSAVGAWETTLSLTGLSGDSISLATATSKFLDRVTLAADSTSSMSFVKSGASNTTFYLAKVREYTVFFDGQNGGSEADLYGVIYYRNAGQITKKTTIDATGEKYYVVVPDLTYTLYNSSYYQYDLRGWVNIYTGVYYDIGTYENTSVEVAEGNTVFYADWMVPNYDIGQKDSYTIDVADTSSFVKSYLFDYNDIMNLYSVSLDTDTTETSGSVYFVTSLSSTSHSERWTLNTSAGVLTSGSNILTKSLDFAFLGAGRAGSLAYIVGRDSLNSSNTASGNANYAYLGNIYTGIIGSQGTTVNTSSTQLLNVLFGTDNTLAYCLANGKTYQDAILGKTYVGEGYNLFRYDDDSGYYYYDSTKNAAAYNQTNETFYVYEYKEMTAASKDENENYSDFLPFNYSSSATTSSVTSYDVYTVDYWFGMQTEIDFYLPDASSSTGSGSVNQSYGNDMVFRFSGDDDVWVCVDDVLVLDLGGMHGAVYGEINFSTGVITIGQNGATKTTDSSGMIAIDASSSGVSTSTMNFSSGSHKLTVYYLERGASQSNLAICFNISPVYTVKLAKQITSGSTTTSAGSGVKFAVYTSEDMDDDSFLTYAETYSNGVLTINELMPGRTYYLKEVTAPAGYPLSYKYITVYVDSAGNATVHIYSSSGEELETLECIEGEDDYTGGESIETLIASGGTYGVFGMSTSTSAEGVSELLMVDDTDINYKYYLLGNLSVFDAYNSKYSSYRILTMTYVNYYEYELPSTGSTGIFPYERAGIILVLVAILGLLMIAISDIVQRRRMCMNAYKRGYNEEKAGRENRYAGTRDRPQQRNRIYGRDAPASFSDGSQERSRGTGPGTE